MERACYQFGNLTRKKRAKGRDTWEFRYYESTEQGDRRRKSCIVGTVEKLPTKAHAQKAVEALLLTLNSETPQQRMAGPSARLRHPKKPRRLGERWRRNLRWRCDDFAHPPGSRQSYLRLTME